MTAVPTDPAAAIHDANAPADAATPPAGKPIDPSAIPISAHRDVLRETWFDRIEGFLSALSARDPFWSRILSFLFLPLAFFSGIKMKALDANTFAAYLPFTKFNRNFYNAMAGGALLANSEIAGGMYVFGIVGEKYTVVCKDLNYKFLRPCLGPAVYKMRSRENLRELVAGGGEFDVTLDLDVQQQVRAGREKDKRVGRCVATFHVTPKALHKLRAARRERGRVR